MFIKPVEFLSDTDDLIFWDEDIEEEPYCIQIEMSFTLIYNLDENKNEILVGNGHDYLNIMPFTLTEHNMVESVILDLDYTYDYDSEDSDRVLWEYLELFYFVLFNKIYFVRDTFFEEFLDDLYLRKKQIIFIFSEFELFLNQPNLYIFKFIFISLINRFLFFSLYLIYLI